MAYLDCTNDEGEWMMTASELRLEAELDALSAQERADEAWLDSYDDEGDECDHSDGEWPDLNYRADGTAYCPWCLELRLEDELDVPKSAMPDDYWQVEDAHLDGMWEE